MSTDKLHDREITPPDRGETADLPVVRVMALPGTAGGATLTGAPVVRDEVEVRADAVKDGLARPTASSPGTPRQGDAETRPR